MNMSRTAIAASAAMAAKASVPSRVARILRVACTEVLLSAGHDRNTGPEGAQVTRLRAAARVEGLDVLDEVADDVAGVVVRHRIVAVALAWVVEALALRGPPRDVERREVGHGHGGAAVPAERTERRQHDLQDPGVARIEVRELAPAVRGGAGRRLLGAEHALVHARGHLVGGAAGLDGHARPGLCRRPQRTRPGWARGAAVARVGRRASPCELVLQLADAGIAVERLVLAA